ncbi:hypothetical protein P7C70_g2052, partial [Phenoliferia sp. Uapishka_3]
PLFTHPQSSQISLTRLHLPPTALMSTNTTGTPAFAAPLPSTIGYAPLLASTQTTGPPTAPAPQARRQVARMSTGGRAPRRAPQVPAVAAPIPVVALLPARLRADYEWPARKILECNATCFLVAFEDSWLNPQEYEHWSSEVSEVLAIDATGARFVSFAPTWQPKQDASSELRRVSGY